MNEQPSQIENSQDTRLTQIERDNERLQKTVRNLRERLKKCQDQKAKALSRHIPLTERELVRTVIEDTEEQWQETLDESGDFWFYALAVEILIREIDMYAAIYSGDELRKYVNESTAGDLLKYFRQASMVIDNHPIPEIRERVITRDRAIHELVNRRDEGAALRQIVRQEPNAASRIAEWRTRVKLAGSAKGQKEFSKLIGEKVAVFHGEGDSVDVAAQKTVDYFFDLNPTTAAEKIAKKRLESSSDPAPLARRHYFNLEG